MMPDSKNNGQDLMEFLESGKKTVLFLHNKESVQKIIPCLKSIHEKKVIIIPTSPEPLFSLDALKIPYQIPEHYYTLDEYYNYTKDIESKIITVAKEIDNILYELYPKIKQSGLKPAFYSVYSLVRIYSPLLESYFKIEQIIKKEKPDQIGLISTEQENVYTTMSLEGLLLWGAKENIFKKVLEIYQSNLTIRFFAAGNYGSLPDNFLRDYWRDKLKNWFLTKPRLLYFLKTVKKDTWMALLIFFSKMRLKPLLLLNGGYNWDLCNKELYKKGYYVWGQINDNLENWRQKEQINPKLFKKIFSRLEESDSFRKSFKEKNIDFYPLLKDKIGLFFKAIVPASLFAWHRTSELIKKKQLKGVLFSINPTAVSKSIARAAQQSGIPVIGWQHGDTNYKPTPSVVLNDLLVCDLFLSWGEGASRNRREVARELTLERNQKNVGSASLDRLASLPAPDCFKVLKKIGIKHISRPIIVYATTMYYLSNTYNFAYPPWSDNNIYSTQKKIIKQLAALKGTKIIKLHPTPFYALPVLDEYCQSFAQQNVWTVRNAIDASSLFSVADAIIIDAPSTTLLQAIACKKPVFCITKHLKLGNKTEALLAKRVVLSENPEELMKEVEYFIESKKYKADIDNDEFLKSFGTVPDGRASQRAATAVDELIKRP